MAIRTFSLKLIIFLFMAGQVSASETTITKRSDFENFSKMHPTGIKF